MEEEVGVKVTRLRRRLSVEAEDVKSPSTQSTPTKKRGGRLAAKPQLELIDENATEVEKPKRTRKSVARDAEPEEKAVTPSRRSTRIKSNTSIVSETPVEVEDKGTPSRRNTRIKSNTSIVADTVQYSESPRAKRAARRTSQVGSDNEAPVTPARQTRRTRKDSTSSVDKQVESADVLGSQIKEVIVEEVEDNIKETKNKETSPKDKNESPTTRKSPRLVQNTSKSLSPVNDNKENEPQITKNSNKNISDVTENSAVTSTTKSTEEINLSVSTTYLINELDDQPKKGKVHLNKTTSAVEETPKSKRQRTKSWTTITSSPSNDNTFLSDTEAIKKKNKRKSANMSGSGDNLLNTSKQSVKEYQKQDDNKEVSFNSSVPDKKKNKNDKALLETETASKEISSVHTSLKVNKSLMDVKVSSTEIKKDNLDSSQKNDPNFTEKYFGEAPSGTVQSLVFIEDSDSNTENAEKEKINKKLDSEDQCVPVVEHQLVDQSSKEAKNDLSYEPMDIDETMPENVSLSVFAGKNETSQSMTRQSLNVKEADQEGLKKRKSFHNVSQVSDVSIDNISNKSQRKSTILDMEDGEQITLNKSNRKSLVSDDIEIQSFKKSKRKSSISNVDVDNDLNKDSNQAEIGTTEETVNKSLNKSGKKSSISNPVNDDTDNNYTNVDDCDGANKSMKKSKRKSLVTNNNIDKDNKSLIANQSTNDSIANKSKRKSSISTMDSSQVEIDGDATTNSSNKSKRKSSISNINNEEVDSGLNNLDQDDSMNSSANKSKKKPSITNVTNNHSVMKDADKSSIAKIVDNDEVDCSHNYSLVSNHDDKSNKNTSNSKPKSSILNTTSENVNKSKNKSADVIRDESINKSSVKSERKSSFSKTDVEYNMDKKSKRKSSISNLESQILEKTTDANKSTLVLSQIKDTSETSVQKDIYEFNETNDSAEQLSKSANVPNANNKESEKKNLSLTYSTSTPLQQKSLKKLGMQINSSIIAPNSVTKTDNKNSKSKAQKETSILSQNDEESEVSDGDEDPSEEEEDDDEDNDSDEESVDKSKMIDMEADEASDDYESGDSRDEDEREYEEQNEIVEKGETLDSEEDDFSDDSEYEKGSFIVDSDEEDNDLLSGSGDDLSMSADELSMSAKSKKKFNERKIKEQKKASREMFEARHNLNDSNKSGKSDKLKAKKNNRQRFESSESESEEEIGQLKKNRRARIDSSQDISMNQSEADKSVSKKKKKVKRLSESVCEEKEINIHKNNEIEKDDPLSLQNVIKEEPKTPKKDLNISTVAITNVEEVEEVEIDENVSIMKSNQTSDPLQATAVQDESIGDDSAESISENEEITQNFESVLNDLNKQSKKVKTQDISLNLDKKNKQKAKEPIVDELNLTQVKPSKKKQVGSSSDAKQLDKSKPLTNKNIEKVNKSVTIQEEGSSDSIDMKLLFNEDSTDGEIKETAENKNDKQIAEDFIPLKRTEGKTNLLETSSISGNNESILNVSKSKKNKRQSLQPEEIVMKDAEEETNIGFFIDTTGAYTDANKSVTDTSVKGSAKKNKNKKDVSFANIEEIKNDDDSKDAPLEVSFISEKTMNKSKQDLSITQIGVTEVKTPSESAKKKKNNKNKKRLNSSQTNIDDQNVEDTDDVANKSTEVPVITVTSSNKKKKNKLSVSQVEETENQAPTATYHNTSTINTKKQEQKTVSESLAVEKKVIIEESTAVVIEEKISKKRKRKPSANPSIEETAITEDTKTLDTPQTLNDSVIPTNRKKKRKINDEDDSTQTQGSNTVPESQQEQEGSAEKKSKKKNKNITKQIQEPQLLEDEDDSSKKRKKRKERDDDDGKMLSKVVKQNSFDSVHVPRLPANVLKQLDDKPKNVAKAKLISTTSFQVEETKRRRNKPSNYLEQSVYLNDSVEEQTKQSLFKKPKVLPFTPTASTSGYGFTTKFSVNVLPQEVQFIAQSTDISNFKNDLLQQNRIKKLGTFEKYKRHRNIKLSKF